MRFIEEQISTHADARLSTIGLTGHCVVQLASSGDRPSSDDRERSHAVEWNDLNKGTHEDGCGEEFDTPLVKEMLTAVMEVEAAIEADGKAQVETS